jgi:hypothetical protein
MRFLHSVEELNLAANNFSSDSVLVNPAKLFASISSLPKLTKLNLSRNKFKGKGKSLKNIRYSC